MRLEHWRAASNLWIARQKKYQYNTAIILVLTNYQSTAKPIPDKT